MTVYCTVISSQRHGVAESPTDCKMVLSEEIHVFASHKGGTGKTQLCFQCATQYADQHTDQTVLLFDMTELGDLTKRCLGGQSVKDTVIEKHFGKIFDLIETAKKVAEQASGEGGVMARFGQMLRGKCELDLEGVACRPADHNAAVPQNMLLISSGAATFDDHERSVEDTLKIAASFREAISKSANHNFKVFMTRKRTTKPAASPPDERCATLLINSFRFRVSAYCRGGRTIRGANLRHGERVGRSRGVRRWPVGLGVGCKDARVGAMTPRNGLSLVVGRKPDHRRKF